MGQRGKSVHEDQGYEGIWNLKNTRMAEVLLKWEREL